LKKVPTPSQTTTKWSMPLNVGDYGIHYLLRAVVAQKALGANLPQDAVYAYTGFDGAGKELVSPNHYVIHFRAATQLHLPGEIPPVNPGGFWSITMYDGNAFLVPDSPYNALGKPFVQGHQLCLNPDKSLDVFIQPEQPSNAQQACNWLKSPQADATPNNFILFIRLYWPDQALFRRVGGWIPPPIQSAGQ
jgi:hypothetical protein